MTIKATTVPIKTYGELYISEGSIKTAASVIVTNGTIAAGAVEDTRTINQTYLQVTESGQFTVDFTFTGLLGDPAKIEFVGRYEGNPAHDVEVKIWNYDTTAWVDVLATAKDLPSSATDGAFTFQYPADSSDYISGGESQVRIEHESAAVGTHNLYTDYIALITKCCTITNANTFGIMTTMTAGVVNDMTLDAANGTITATRAGLYDLALSLSFSGTPSVLFYFHIFVNGSEIEKIGSKRHTNANGELGALPLSGLLALVANDVVDVRVTSTSSNVFVSVEYMNFKLVRR